MADSESTTTTETNPIEELKAASTVHVTVWDTSVRTISIAESFSEHTEAGEPDSKGDKTTVTVSAFDAAMARAHCLSLYVEETNIAGGHLQLELGTSAFTIPTETTTSATETASA